MSNSRIELYLADKAHNLLREAEYLPGDAGATLPRQVGALSLLAEMLNENKTVLTPDGVQQVIAYLDQIELWLLRELSTTREGKLPAETNDISNLDELNQNQPTERNKP